MQITLKGRECIFGFDNNGAYYLETMDEEFNGDELDIFYGVPVEILAHLKHLYEAK